MKIRDFLNVKKLKNLCTLAVVLGIAFFVTSCAREDGPGGATTPATGPQITSQGITDYEILIGSTFMASGVFAFIGVPIIDTMVAVFERANAHGGIGGRQITFLHHDDNNDPITGRILLERLLEEYQVFALSVISGVNAPMSLEYMREFGAPVLGITGGIAFMYSEYDPGSNIFIIQPSNGLDGPLMLAHGLTQNLFGPNRDQRMSQDAMIGLMFPNTDAGNDVYNGIADLAEYLGITHRIMAEIVTPETYFTIIQQMIDANVELLLVGSLDTMGITAAMSDAGWYVPVIGAYGTSTVASHTPEIYSPDRRIFATIWAQDITPEARAFLDDMGNALTYHPTLDEATAISYVDNGFARAGFITAMALIVALERMEATGQDWTWENFINVMEAEPFLLGGTPEFSFAGGRRMGVESLALWEYTAHMGPDGQWIEEQHIRTDFVTVEELVADIRAYWGQ
ncbi:MAG: ABC transporter substrate-binding protein [Defluviitaleaceae bacterium]|nr:ABC transporter substrate-binding protein [Defluviitaleaceae bacterium]